MASTTFENKSALERDIRMAPPSPVTPSSSIRARKLGIQAGEGLHGRFEVLDWFQERFSGRLAVQHEGLENWGSSMLNPDVPSFQDPEVILLVRRPCHLENLQTGISNCTTRTSMTYLRVLIAVRVSSAAGISLAPRLSPRPGSRWRPPGCVLVRSKSAPSHRYPG
jgi:hypothetical protein